MLEPRARTLEVLRLSAGQWIAARTVGGFTMARVEPFDAVEIDLGSLWWPEGTEPPAG